MFASYRKSGSLNPFLVTNLRPEVDLIYCACADIIVTKVAGNGDATATLQENGRVKFKYDVGF